MAANVLTGRVQITAPGAVQLFDNLGKGLTKLQQQVTAFGGGVQKFNTSFSNLAVPVNKASTGLNNLTRTSSSATQSMINLGRVVQDAPFGFLGIANNLNPLLESFQRLKTTTGSTGGALKALRGELLGAGGLGFALSTVSSLLIVFGDKLFGTSVHFSSAEIAAGRFEVALSRLKQGVSDLKDELEFGASIQKLALQFSTLKGGELSAALGGVDIATNAKLVEGLTEQINKLQASNDKLKSSTVAQQEAFAKFTGKVSPLAKLFLQFGDEIPSNLAEKLSTAEKAILSQYQKTNDELKKLNADRIKALLSIGVSPLQGAADIFKDQQSIKELKIKPDKLKIIKPEKIDFTGPAEDKTTGGLEFGQMFSKELNDYFKGPFTTDFSLLEAIKPVVLSDMEKLAIQISDSLSNLAGDSLSSIAEGIGDVLGGGDLQNAFQGFARVIGQGFIAIGRQMVAAAPIIAALKAALKTLNPAVLLPAGLGLIAIGAALNSAVGRGIGRRARGGPVSGGLGYLVGEDGPEFFRPNTGGTIVPNNALGGGNFSQGGMVVNVTGEFLQRGQDLLAVITLANQSKLRLQ